MNEQSVFFEALEIQDPLERFRFLNRACQNEPQLRKQVEALLIEHERSGDFLNIPALKQIAPPPEDSDAREHTITTIGEPQLSESIDFSFLLPSDDPQSLGRLGHYEVREMIGRGGCGIVMKAFDSRLERVVAIKIMAPELAATSPARKRFLREARATAAIRHQNVVNIYAVEELPIPFLVMEFIDGPTLQQRINAIGPLDVTEVLLIGEKIAAGLAAAHDKGLIHRDVKPANILLEKGNNEIKITDFGLARSADDASVTQSGVIAGTPLYMSPEQAQALEISPQSDLFSLGSVLYLMYCGRPPFRASTTLAVLKRVVEDRPRPIQQVIPEAPPWFCDILEILLQKNPRRRFTSAQQVSQLLADCRDALMRGNGVELPEDARQLLAAIREQPHANTPLSGKVAPDSLPETPPRAKRRNRLLVGFAAALLVLVLGLGMTEGTGVTNFRGTVVTLFTSQGTLVVEVDDPDVELAIDGEELVVKGAGVKELRLRPGEYQLEANKAGKLLQKEIVRVDRNGRTVVRIRQDVGPEVAAAKTSTMAAKRKETETTHPSTELSRKPLRIEGGDWRGEYELVNGEFSQTVPKSSGILFGDPNWTDFDLRISMKHVAGPESGHIIFRSSADRSRMYLFYFILAQNKAFLVRQDPLNRLVDAKEFSFASQRWYQIDIKSRDSHFTIEVDGLRLFEFEDSSLDRGCIGFNTFYSSAKWRDLTVTSPDGQLLWEGFPEVPLSERKMAEIVLDLGGIVSMHGETKEIRRIEDLPPGNQRLTNVTLASLPNVTKEKLLPLEDTRHLTNLGLDYAPNIDDEVLTIFRHNKNLEGMGLSRSRITAEGLRSLEGFDKLDRIWLTASAIQNDDLSAFEVFPNLTALGLSDTKITDAGLHHLSNIPKLTWLILDRTAVTDEGLRKLSEIKTLRRIELNGTKVTDEGLVYLQNLPDLDRVMIKETKVSLAGIQKLYETHPGVVVVWDGYSWTKKKEPPDYDEIATREWLPLLRSQEEIDQLISEKAFIYDGLEAPPEISFQDGVTELRAGGLFFRALRAKNGILRAKLRHIEGFHVDLVLRKGYGNEKTHLSYNGDGTFHIGRSRNGWKPLLGRFFSDPQPEFIEVAFAAMDRKLIVYVNGHKLMETEDDVGALEELPGSHPGIMASYRGGIATGQFKDVEFQYLD